MPAEFWWKITAIIIIAVSLITTLILELRKPKRDPNENPDTKRMNNMLKD